MNSANKSEIAVLKVELRANEKGYFVSLPKNQASRYDLVIDDGKKLYRAQIKYLNRYASNLKNKTKKTSLELALYNPRNPNGRNGYTEDEIDILLVYCPVIDEILAFYPNSFHNKKTIPVNLYTPECKWFYKNHIW